jgi:DNA-binding CsgD family transcriptional regulator
METPLPPGSRVLLVLPPREGSAPAGELILEGRHYHLVPVLPAEPVSAPATSLPDARRLLTARELQIVSHVAAGRVNKQIAAELNISTWTVAAHLRRIFTKLGVETRAAMVSRCFGTPGAPRAP